MTITELQIQLDLNPDNRVNVLKNVDTCRRLINVGWLFVDSEDGQCYLFDYNGNLDDVNEVIWISMGAFRDCISLKGIKIPSSVKTLGISAFEDCKSLTNVEILNSIRCIKTYAFYNCRSLTSIKIPNSVKYIGAWAFKGCTSLKEVVFKGKTIKQVKAMENYPWGIEDESIIKVEN